MKSLDNSHRKYSISSIGNSEADKIEFMTSNMHLNKAYFAQSKKINDNLNKIKILENLKIDLLNTGRVGGISLLML